MFEKILFVLKSSSYCSIYTSLVFHTIDIISSHQILSPLIFFMHSTHDILLLLFHVNYRKMYMSRVVFCLIFDLEQINGIHIYSLVLLFGANKMFGDLSSSSSMRIPIINQNKLILNFRQLEELLKFYEFTYRFYCFIIVLFFFL